MYFSLFIYQNTEPLLLLTWFILYFEGYMFVYEGNIKLKENDFIATYWKNSEGQ